MALDSALQITGRTSKLINIARSVKESLDNRDHSKLKDALVRFGVPEDEAEEFSKMIIDLATSDKEQIKQKIIDFVINIANKKKVSVKREEVEDAVEGLVTIAEALIKNVHNIIPRT